MKYFIRFGLCLLFVCLTSESFAAQKRYKKRHHKLQLSGALNIDNDLRFNNSHLSINYARNIGMFEFGALLGLLPSFALGDLGGLRGFIQGLGLNFGLLTEYNFIKNKRRNNTVPAFGLKLTFHQQQATDIYIVPYLALKSFISTRTSINTELEYPIMLLDQLKFNFAAWKGIRLSIGYAYYFH